MGNYFQDIDSPHFDYRLATCDRLPAWRLRGPLPDLNKPYFVCIGAEQVFGRFCDAPFPDLLSRAIGLPVLNLGLPGSGPRQFLEEDILSVINGAEFAIVQVMSGNTESNSEFENPGSDGVQGTRKSDGSKMLFNEFLAEKFATSQQALVARVVEETRESWVARYRELLTSIKVPKVLHWFSTSAPRRTDDYSNFWKLLGPLPQLVNRRMINQIVPFADTYLQTVRNSGLPQALWQSDKPIDGAELLNGTLFNNYYPSPEMHEAAVRDLLPASKVLASGVHARSDDERTTVVVAANAFEGMTLADLFGPRSKSIPYRQLLEDRGLLPFVVRQKPRILHLRRRNLLAGYLADLFASQPGAKDVASLYVGPVGFATYVHSTAKAERLIAAACEEAEVYVEYFEDFITDPTAFVDRNKSLLSRQEPNEQDIAISIARLPPEQTAANRGELNYLFDRILRSIPKGD